MGHRAGQIQSAEERAMCTWAGKRGNGKALRRVRAGGEWQYAEKHGELEKQIDMCGDSPYIVHLPRPLGCPHAAIGRLGGTT